MEDGADSGAADEQGLAPGVQLDVHRGQYPQRGLPGCRAVHRLIIPRGAFWQRENRGAPSGESRHPGLAFHEGLEVDSGFYRRVRASVIIGLVAFALAGCATRSPSPGTVLPTSEAARRSELPRVPDSSRMARQPSAELPTKEEAADTAARAAQQAVKMVGKPYRFGGSSPSTGFDCSGLIQFSFRQAGVMIPRSTAEQRRASIRVSSLHHGDLLFFDQEGKKNSHAGIYVGNGHFVHAPSSGKRVRIDRLDSPYWRKHLSEVRRIDA